MTKKAAAKKAPAKKTTHKKAVKEAPATEQPEQVIIAYKGFDKDFKCRGFQYEVGKTYENNGNVSVCNSGFHACQNPLSVWRFYGVNNDNRFAVVEQSGQLVTEGEKTASGKIKVKAEIGIPGIIKAAVEWTQKAAASVPSASCSHSATSGRNSHSATSGRNSHSATSGYGSHSATSGPNSNSATSGFGSKSSAKGKNSVAANAGDGASRAGKGGAIFIVERDSDLKILAVFASLVGENGIKPDTWYVLKNGKPVEVADDE